MPTEENSGLVLKCFLRHSILTRVYSILRAFSCELVHQAIYFQWPAIMSTYTDEAEAISTL